MPNPYNFGRLTIEPGNPSFAFSFSWGLFGVGPVFPMISPERLGPGTPDHKMWITDYATGQDASGNTYYSGLISSNYSRALFAKLLVVWWPEFQGTWNA